MVVAFVVGAAVGCGGTVSRVGLIGSETAATYAESLERTDPDKAMKIAKAVIVVNEAQIIYNVAFAQVLCARDAAADGCDQVPVLPGGTDVDQNRRNTLIALEAARAALVAISGGSSP